MEFRSDLVSTCGIYCGACRLFVLKRCDGCIDPKVKGEVKCPYTKCATNKEISFCGQCREFPCLEHYGSMAVYTKRKFLDWKKREIGKANS